PRIRIDVDQTAQTDVETGFFARFADGCVLYQLAAVHVAARIDPLAVARLDRALHQHDAAAAVVDDRADRHFRVEVEDKPAAHAHEPLGLVLLDRARLKCAAAHRAETVWPFVVRMHRRAAYNLPSCRF